MITVCHVLVRIVRVMGSLFFSQLVHCLKRKLSGNNTVTYSHVNDFRITYDKHMRLRPHKTDKTRVMLLFFIQQVEHIDNF